MIFTSISFLFFMAVVLTVYWPLPRRAQNLFLLAASYYFYGFVHPWFCILVALTTVIDWFIALAMAERPRHKRLLVVGSLVANIGLLGVYKYFDFFVSSAQAALAALGFDVSLPTLRLMLPVGISFYTFQSLSYTLDVYRGLLQPRRNLLDFALFVVLFPQLVAGPIERARNLLPQIEKERTIDFQRIESAVCLIAWGFFKKLVVADTIAIFVERIFAMPRLCGLMLFTGGFSFMMQLFADFSAYTDIARGSARLLGFELMKNFEAPFAASSPVEFWRRWHISLSSWIRDYLFVSLPGSRRSRWRFALNQLTTFLVFGLWHGAGWNFILWGLYNGVATVIYSLWFRPWTRLVKQPWPERFLRAGGVVLWNLVLFGGALLFRQHDTGILIGYFSNNPLTHRPEELVLGLGILCTVSAFTLPMLVQPLVMRFWPDSRLLRVFLAWLCAAAVIFVGREGGIEFVYFAF
jgi:D-alanyl-lipoteichoic acid acyltransferase DltB (MBOAT superfamily)